MEAWAAAKRVSTALHGLTPAQPGPGRTGLEVPTGVRAGGGPQPTLLVGPGGHLQTPGPELRRWPKLLSAWPARGSRVPQGSVCREPRGQRSWAPWAGVRSRPPREVLGAFGRSRPPPRLQQRLVEGGPDLESPCFPTNSDPQAGRLQQLAPGE